MNNFETNVITELMRADKYECITECSKILNPDKPSITVTKYEGSSPRMFINDDNELHLIVPSEMSYAMEGAVSNSIANGTIFDDAETVNNTAKYIELTTIPYKAIVNAGKVPPKKLKFVLTGIISPMDEEGHCKCDDTDLKNGYNYIKDITHCDMMKDKLSDITSKYLGNNADEICLDKSIDKELASIKDDLSNMDGITPDDEITDDDFKYLDVDDGHDFEEKDYQESFLSKRPKKLKPIPRDIISYITIEMNAIQDSNDQAMLSGYTCSKLELVEFYLNCIDTNDARYVVPHNRQYLINMQTQLNTLLTQILRIRPINKNDRVWQVNVNYPEGWRG